MTGRILIIVSYNGLRHRTIVSPADMLRKQAEQLRRLRHHLDKVLIVVPDYATSQNLDPEYEEALKLFSDILRVPNGDQASYGAWRDGFLANPSYEWYFFLEDDYTFVLDDFDQAMIDKWTPETSYLAHKIDEGGVLGIHTSMSSGLIRGDNLRRVDWTRFNQIQGGEYNSGLQIGWSDLFETKGLRDISDWYGIRFFVEPGRNRVYGEGKPWLLLPVHDI